MAGAALLKLPALALRLTGRAVALPFRVFGVGLQRRTWLLFYSGYLAALAFKAARRAWRRRHDAYDGLDGLVSFSSRLIAGGGRGGGPGMHACARAAGGWAEGEGAAASASGGAGGAPAIRGSAGARVHTHAHTRAHTHTHTHTHARANIHTHTHTHTTHTTHTTHLHTPTRPHTPAAARAAESEREDRFIYDPLASVLAGRKALSRHGLRPRNVLLLSRSEPVAPAAPPGWAQRAGGGLTRAAAALVASFSPPARPVPRLVMRTRFFDDAVLAATWAGGRGAPDARLATTQTVEALSDAGHGPCQQVVMLGAGARRGAARRTARVGGGGAEAAAARAGAAARPGRRVFAAEGKRAAPPETTGAARATRPGPRPLRPAPNPPAYARTHAPRRQSPGQAWTRGRGACLCPTT